METTSDSRNPLDHDGNSFAGESGWVGKDDGLLVLDKNGNGTIDNGSELFGNNTALQEGGKANGFAALADLDSNADGKIDSKDAAFASLKVWKDSNGDGVTQAGELLTLAEDAGVASLATGFTAKGSVDANGDTRQVLLMPSMLMATSIAGHLYQN